MIYQNDKNENTQNQFSNALKELKIGKLLRNLNILMRQSRLSSLD